MWKAKTWWRNSFFAIDLGCKIKGAGTTLLSVFEVGKMNYLYTESACKYKIYKHRGCTRSEARKADVDKVKKDGMSYIIATHDKNNLRSVSVMKK